MQVSGVLSRGMLEPEVRAGGAIGAGKDLACGGFGERREVLGV